MKVSVLMVTYNHEKYIAKALDSVLMQKVDFEYEVVVGEDCSTDHTRDIVLDYHQRHPDKIVALLRANNIGMMHNFTSAVKACTGRYIALLDGDDYWTNPDKLQLQVDFLEDNPDFCICFHNVLVENEIYPERSSQNNDSGTPGTSTLDDLLMKGNYLSTSSVVMRSSAIQNLPDWFNILPFGDFALYLIASRTGKIRYFNEVMGAYRIHQGGAHGHLFNSVETMAKAFEKHYQFWNIIKNSEMFEAKKISNLMLQSLENVIRCAANAKQTDLFLKYNLMLLKQRGIRGVGMFAALNIRYFCEVLFSRVSRHV